jgi:hypothetical protein
MGKLRVPNQYVMQFIDDYKKSGTRWGHADSNFWAITLADLTY